MRKIYVCYFILAMCVSILMSGCASLMDANFKTKDGKESAFKGSPNKYEIPRDPTFRE